MAIKHLNEVLDNYFDFIHANTRVRKREKEATNFNEKMK
jgi:hypothetical protein